MTRSLWPGQGEGETRAAMVSFEPVLEVLAISGRRLLRSFSIDVEESGEAKDCLLELGMKPFWQNVKIDIGEHSHGM